MDSGFKPAKRPARSLQDALNEPPAETPTPNAETFQTPDQVAASDDVGQASEPLNLDLPGDDQPPKSGGNWLDKLKAKIKQRPGKKEWIISGATVIVCGSIVGFVLNNIGDKPVATAKPVKVAKVAPKVVPSTLTGLPVDPSVNSRPVTGVMIENSQAARPQAGLGEAGVVFEAIAEGGITRFLALFQDTAPADIGPVRSARPYYISWLQAFDAAYAHVGGSPEALANIRALGVKDLDQFANAGAYHRISSRPAPHNVHTSMAALNQLEAAKGYNTSTYTGFDRKKKAAPAKVPTAKTIDMAISSALYNTHYDYNAATNTYNRSMGGASHVDSNGGQPISPAVVIGMVVPFGIAADGKHSVYQTVGSGQAFIFQDGTVTIGQWAKAGDKNQITFTDAAGKAIQLSPGRTWITAVGDAGKVTYAP